MSHHLSLLLALPGLGALLVLFGPRDNPSRAKWLTGLAMLATFAAALPLWFRYNPKNPEFQLVERLSLFPSLGIRYAVGLDGVSLLLVLLTALIGALSVLAFWRTNPVRIRSYYVALLMLQASLIGAVLSLDLLFFFVCWEVLLVSMAVLIGSGTASIGRIKIRFFVYSVPGSVAMLAGVLALARQHHAATGLYSFDIVQLQAVTIAASTQWWAFLALILGFAITVALFPFQGWLTVATPAEAPSAPSLMATAVLLRLGVFGFVRFSLPLLPDASRHFVPTMAVISMIGIVYCGAMALVQRDWARMLGYVSVSQMAMALLGFCALNPTAMTGSIVQQVNLGVTTGALLLLVGMAHQRRHTRTLSAYRGLGTVMPAFAAVFLLMTLASMGIPLLNGYVGTSLLLRGVSSRSTLWAATIGVGLVLAAVSMGRVYLRTTLGKSWAATSERVPDLGPREWLVLAPLIVLAIWIGLRPAPIVDRINVPVLKVAARVDPAYAHEFQAACDTTVTSELKAASPANQFLAAAPCGPDGRPLPAAGAQ